MRNAGEIVNSNIAFVRYCMDEKQCIPTITNWNALFSFMKEQALLGVGFHGLERMKKDGVDIPRNVLLQWYAVSEQIRQRNVEMNKRCVELVGMLRKDGFESCILKGQGNTVMYPDPYMRTSGDIDVFVLPVGDVNDNHNPNLNSECSISVGRRRKVVMEYVRRRFSLAKIRYQHIDYPIFTDVEVEMHFIPTAKNNPIYNRRLQRWVEERMEEQCRHFVELPGGTGRIAIPTVEFNVVYQLSHLMHHFFDEGVGLRQMMDYYYLLRSAEDKLRIDNGQLIITLRYLNLYQFAGAVMWVLHEVFGLEEQYYMAPPDKWRGKLLLDEIIKGGNFGKHSGLTDHSTGVKYFLKIKRNMRFVRAYPAEALCEPIFRTWHFFWRHLNS